MDDKKRKELVLDLVVDEEFEPDYSVAGQLWFVEKVVRRFEAQGLSDDQIKDEARKIIQKTGAVVKANRDFSLGLEPNGNKRFTARLLRNMRKHRVEILYGAMAFTPEFVEPARLDYLLFLARRRFRSVCRMYAWVNPNYQGYFRYPDTCSTNEHWRVNEDADDFWTELTPPWYPNYSPWKLNASGLAQPVKAIEELFTRKKDACKGNLFDCETTASIVFIDSMCAAVNEDKFVEKLASLGSEYLLIHGFVTDDHTSNFMADTTDKGLMDSSLDAGGNKVTYVAVSASDLQVGDQCYIFNHPLYKQFRPTGSWTGEYSLVYLCGNRDYRSQKGFVFCGHGKNGTLYKFYTDFLNTFKSDMKAARQIMRAHLAFLRGGAPAIVPGTVREEEHDVSIGEGTSAVAYRLLEYDKNVAAKDFTKVPSKTKKKPKKSTSAFVVVQSKTEHVFFLGHRGRPSEKIPLFENIKKRIVDVMPAGASPGLLKLPIKFTRTEPTTSADKNEIYRLDKWGVEYIDKSTNAEKVWPLFVLKGGSLEPNELTHDTLFESPFSLYDPANTDLEVRRPKVDFGAPHQTFLTTNGAF